MNIHGFSVVYQTIESHSTVLLIFISMNIQHRNTVYIVYLNPHLDNFPN